ncbi:MAG TPA: ketol-acid reductoisomerase [bacterium]|nr:ketol-acid reductoisomerase [bacterium]
MDNKITYKERVVVMGFGAQGSAQAMNLKESGRELSVFLRRESPRNAEAREAGLLVVNDPREASAEAEVVALLLPDGEQPRFYREFLEPSLPRGALLVFAHGFAVHYGEIRPREDLDVVLAAPMAQGATVRSEFASGRGVPVLLAVAQDATGRAMERAKAYARGISRCGPFIETTVREEVESDLFAEQAVLCGGMPSLVRAAFDALVEGGVDPRIAYLCCLRELGAIVSVMERHGIAGLFSRISDTARYGALTRGSALVDSGVRERMSAMLEEIRSGRFAEELTEEASRGYPRTKLLSAEAAAHPIERIHEEMTKP